jgi:hypothetical protein
VTTAWSGFFGDELAILDAAIRLHVEIHPCQNEAEKTPEEAVRAQLEAGIRFELAVREEAQSRTRQMAT